MAKLSRRRLLRSQLNAQSGRRTDFFESLMFGAAATNHLLIAVTIVREQFPTPSAAADY
jgi:hypothetical protein